MKTIPIALASAHAREVTTICACLKVTRTDGVVRGYTSHNRELPISGVTYEPGFDLSSLASTASLAVDNMELSILPDGNTGLEEDLRVGRWDNAAFVLFEFDYTTVDDSPGPAVNVLKNGHLGEVQFKDAYFVVEFRGLSQALQQTQGAVTTKTCRARLGDVKCTKDLTAFTFNGTLTAVDGDDPKRIFTDHARSEVDGYFAEGEIRFTGGNNANFSRKIKLFTATGSPSEGTFTLSLPLPFPAQVGDTYTVIAGCNKLLQTCIDKFDNVINFQGEPHLPGLDNLSKPGGAETQPDSTPSVPQEPVDYTGAGD